MDILINGTRIEFQIEQEKTVGEILGSLETECEKAGMTITGIRADGETVALASLDDFFTRSHDSVSRLELDTISGAEIRACMRELGASFSAVAPLLRDIPVQLQTGKDLKVMETIHGFSLSLQNLYQLLPLMSVAGISAKEPRMDRVALLEMPGELSPLLADLLDGLQKKDTVLVGDISEYELAPRIERMGAALSAV